MRVTLPAAAGGGPPAPVALTKKTCRPRLPHRDTRGSRSLAGKEGGGATLVSKTWRERRGARQASLRARGEEAPGGWTGLSRRGEGGVGEKGRGRRRLTEGDVSKTDAQAGSGASAPGPPTRGCRCGQPGAPPPRCRCRGRGPGWGRCAAGGVPTWVWRAWALSPPPGPRRLAAPQAVRGAGFPPSAVARAPGGRPGGRGPAAECRRGAVEGPRPAAPLVPLRSRGVGLPGRGETLRPSLFRFPRGSLASRWGQQPPPSADAAWPHPPPPGSRSGKAPGGRKEPGAQGPWSLVQFQSPRVSLGELVGGDGLPVKVFWDPRVPLRVSASLLNSGRGTGPALSSSGSLWSGPVTLLSPVTPNEAAPKSVDGVQL